MLHMVRWQSIFIQLKAVCCKHLNVPIRDCVPAAGLLSTQRVNKVAELKMERERIRHDESYLSKASAVELVGHVMISSSTRRPP